MSFCSIISLEACLFPIERQKGEDPDAGGRAGVGVGGGGGGG